jgi:hypothetical protein
MTTHDKRIKRKLSLLEPAEFLKNVSQACKINGVSRQHFYDIRKAYEEHGVEGFREKSRHKPLIFIDGFEASSDIRRKYAYVIDIRPAKGAYPCSRHGYK